MPEPLGPSPASLAAWDNSFLAGLPHEVRDALMSDAFVIAVPAGQAFYEPFAPARLALVNSGHARFAISSRSGRIVTVRYVGPGDVVGLTSAVVGGVQATASALVHSELTMLNITTFRRLCASHAGLAWRVATQLAEQMLDGQDLLAENLFATVQQRVSRHLLDLAENSPDGLIVTIDQQGIADAIGSVREVVARSLRKLREEAYIERHRDGIRILCAAELHRLAADSSSAEPFNEA